MSQSSSDAVIPDNTSQPSDTDELQKEVKKLEVNSPKKRTQKRNRISGSESPAKLSRSVSASALAPPRGRGRPRLSDIGARPVNPVKSHKVADYATGGILMAFGMGDAGQLGMGEDILERKRPQLVKEITEDVICVAAGGMHNVFITKDGSVYTFGCNDEGALGRKIQEEEESFLPGKVEGVGSAVFCCAGDSHTAIINDDGEVWVWGTFRDANGRLGVGTGADEDKQVEKAILEYPAKLSLPQKVLRVASGADHLLMLDDNQEVWSLGCAESGQLGRVSSQFSAKGGRRGASKILNPQLIALRRITRRNGNVVDVACGQFSSFLITNTGKVIGFGLNNCFQLGDFSDREIHFSPAVIPFKHDGKTVNVKQLASGMHHTVLLSAEGDVYTIGCGDYGRLGVGEKDKLRESDVLRKVETNGKVVRVARGSCTTYAIKEDGTCLAWGMGTNLQLTNGSEEDEWEPITVSGKNIEGKKVQNIDGGGQHVAILVTERTDTTNGKE